MKLCLLFFLALLTGCTGSVILQAVQETVAQPKVYFCPRENCSEKFLELTRNAGTIDCALYDLSSKTFINALKGKNSRVFVDNANAGKLANTGLDYRWDESEALSHNKFCVIDKKIVWTGSFNPTVEGDRSTANNVIVLESKYLATNYEDEFEELWNGNRAANVRYPYVNLNGAMYESYFCPEDCKQAVARIIGIMEKSNESIYFMTFSFTDNKIGDTIIAADKGGIDVRGVFEKSQQSTYSQYQRLKDSGLKVRYDNKLGLMHHKVFIIDERIVVTGSWNPTGSGSNRNDENILIIHDSQVARAYLTEFYRAYGD